MCPEFCIVHCSVDYSCVPRPLLERATRIRVGAILHMVILKPSERNDKGCVLTTSKIGLMLVTEC